MGFGKTCITVYRGEDGSLEWCSTHQRPMHHCDNEAWDALTAERDKLREELKAARQHTPTSCPKCTEAYRRGYELGVQRGKWDYRSAE